MAKNTDEIEIDQAIGYFRSESWQSFLKLLDDMKASDPPLYAKIDKADCRTWENVVKVLISEAECKTAARSVKATKLLCHVLSGPQHDRPSNQLPRNQQLAVITLLSAKLQDPDYTVRRTAATTLGLFAGPCPHDVVGILVNFGINNNDYQTAQAAMSSLLEAGSDAASVAISVLCDVAEHHEHEQAREEACNTLRDLGEKSQEVLTTLVKSSVDDPSQTVRLSAIRALQKLIERKLLIEKLNDAASDKSTLNAGLVRGGAEFRQLRQGLQKVDEPTVSDQPGSGSMPCPTIPRETLEAAAPTRPEVPATTSDQLTQTPTGNASIDGPQTPNKFVWKGKFAELQPRSWDVVDFLWHVDDDHKAQEDDVFDAVWGPESRVGPRALTSAISRANNSFVEKGIPISVNKKKGYVIITIDQN